MNHSKYQAEIALWLKSTFGMRCFEPSKDASIPNLFSIEFQYLSSDLLFLKFQLVYLRFQRTFYLYSNCLTQIFIYPASSQRAINIWHNFALLSVDEAEKMSKPSRYKCLTITIQKLTWNVFFYNDSCPHPVFKQSVNKKIMLQKIYFLFKITKAIISTSNATS